MPITRPSPLTFLNQDEFGALAYEVKALVIGIHKEFGRFFDERVYKLELARRFPGTRLEVPVKVTFRDFVKRYFLDVLVRDGGVFEFKVTDILAPRHKAQLLHYLMLCDLAHGMLISVRRENLLTEFVNTRLTLEKRLLHQINSTRWSPKVGSADTVFDILSNLLIDWGAGLDISLYEEALTHFLGGESLVEQPIMVTSGGEPLTQQKIRLCAPRVAFKLTAFPRLPATFEPHARRFLAHTELDAIQWINITPSLVTFTTIN